MTPRKFFHALSVVAGLVLIWRGIWHGVDGIEELFGGSSAIGATVSILLGVAILYLPDHDLNEIEKL